MGLRIFSQPPFSRLVIDYRSLNRTLIRTAQPLGTVDSELRKVAPGSAWFLIMVLISSYYQLELDEDSRNLTGFISPWGDFHFTRCPMGAKPSADGLSAALDRIFTPMICYDRFLRVMDDCATQGETLPDLVRDTREFLSVCRTNRAGITPKKVELAQPGQFVVLAGKRIGSRGIAPKEETMEAFRAIPSLTTTSEVRMISGMAVQLSAWYPSLSTKTRKLRTAMLGAVFDWTTEMETELNGLKEFMSTTPILQPFNLKKKTCLLVDSSILEGTGYLICQVAWDWQLGDSLQEAMVVQCGSVSAGRRWKSYSAYEVECAGLVWACHHARHYIRGLQVVYVLMDHRPLAEGLNGSLADLTERSFRMLELISEYNLVGVHERKGTGGYV